MSADPTGFIRQLIASDGTGQGIIVDGYLQINRAAGGLVLVDSTGAKWLFTVGTDGRLATQGITF